MAASAADLFQYVGNPGTATTLSAPGYTQGNSSINVGSTANFPTLTGVIFAIDTFTTVGSEEVRNDGTYCVFSGVVSSGTQITGVTLLSGTPQDYAAGATTRVYITVSALHTNRIVQGILQHADQTGALIPAAVRAALQTSNAAASGWVPIAATITGATCSGQRSYNLTISSDQTAVVSNGMRFQTTRTVAAPVQSASLNGTTQYFSKSSPAGTTFTDDFTASAWVKMTSYGALSAIVSRYNGTSGWSLQISATGLVTLVGFNASSANSSDITGTQSIPINKWVHIAAQLDMSTFTATTTTSYIMIDGVNVPATVTRAGTNPTALVQAGNLEVGSRNGGTAPFPGKLAQVAIFSAKVTQATILGYMSQTYAGTETSLISAYSLSNSVNDLNTSNANNLTANGSATTTNADSPFGNSGVSTTLDYGIVTAVTSTTITAQVPEGCTIPTSGGVSSVAYSNQRTPFGFPSDGSKWTLLALLASAITTTAAINTVVNPSSFSMTVPVGAWNLGMIGSLFQSVTVSSVYAPYGGLSTSSSSIVDPELAVSAVSRPGATGLSTFPFKIDKYISLSSATPYYTVVASQTGSGTNTVGFDASINLGFMTIVKAICAYL